MNNHLTDRQLLNAQFKFCSDAQAETIAAHTAECAECRGRANALKQKFASLELLRGDVSASEQLVAETLRQVRNIPVAERSPLPRFAWLAGAAAVAAVVLAIFYTGPVATQPVSMAKVEPPAEPVMQVAMQMEEMKEPETVPAEAAADEEMGYERAEVVGTAGEVKPAASKALMASRARGFAAAPPAPAIKVDVVTGATYPAPRWMSDAPANVTVQIYPAMVESDEAVRGLKKDSGLQAQQWSMNVISRSDQPVTALITRAFGTTHWSVSVLNQAVQVITQNPNRVALSVAVKPRGTTTFTCTTILPSKPAEGDTP